ncbi:hypothetical protein PENTCL1PPCAC_22178, partial [Pristionchus entomophagus]
RPGMTRDLVGSVDGITTMGQISFMDLPDDMLINIFTHLDHPSRFKLRLNRRLNQIQLSVKNKLDVIELKTNSDAYELSVKPSNLLSSIPFRDFDKLELGLRRLVLNTHVNGICIVMGDSNELNTRIIDAFVHFDADKMFLGSFLHQLPRLNSSILLSITQNISHVNFSCKFHSLSTQDLCIIRKTMIESDCKLQYFYADVGNEIREYFAKECFGVTLDDDSTHIHRISDDNSFSHTRSCFQSVEGDVQSTIRRNYLTFEKVITTAHSC